MFLTFQTFKASVTDSTFYFDSFSFCIWTTQLLMSCIVLKHSLSGNAKILPFDPKITCNQECLITTFQDVYFVSESFEEAKVRMR